MRRSVLSGLVASSFVDRLEHGTSTPLAVRAGYGDDGAIKRDSHAREHRFHASQTQFNRALRVRGQYKVQPSIQIIFFLRHFKP